MHIVTCVKLSRSLHRQIMEIPVDCSPSTFTKSALDAMTRIFMIGLLMETFIELRSSSSHTFHLRKTLLSPSSHGTIRSPRSHHYRHPTGGRKRLCMVCCFRTPTCPGGNLTSFVLTKVRSLQFFTDHIHNLANCSQGFTPG